MTANGRRHRLTGPVLVLDSFLGRLRGAIGRRGWRETVFVLTRTNVVHTWFMPGAIDVAFLDSDGRIVRIARNLGPWRVSPWVRQATAVVEAAAGRLADWAEGDWVEVPAPGRRRGQAIVEFALVLPLMLLLILGGIDLLTLAGSAGVVAAAAQDAANACAAGIIGEHQALWWLVRNNLAAGIGLDSGAATVTVIPRGSCEGTADGFDGDHARRCHPVLVTVRVSVPYQFVVPLPTALPDTVSITRSATVVARTTCVAGSGSGSS